MQFYISAISVDTLFTYMKQIWHRTLSEGQQAQAYEAEHTLAEWTQNASEDELLDYLKTVIAEALEARRNHIAASRERWDYNELVPLERERDEKELKVYAMLFVLGVKANDTGRLVKLAEMLHARSLQPT